MLNFHSLGHLLFGNGLVSSSMASVKGDELFDAGLTMGTLYIGKQGTGKTTALARHLVDYFKRYPDRAMFVLDWSGGITDAILAMLLGDKENLKRVIYDEWGNTEWVVPLPEFSLAYGGTYESQIQRVVSNMSKLSPSLISGAPILGGLSINEMSPHFFRLLTAMTYDEVDSSETWQITEAKRLILEPALLRKSLNKYGSKIPETAWYLNHEFLSPDMKASEREMRTMALRAVLNITDIREVRAKLGYYRPGWTPKEAIDGGKLVLIDAAKLIDQKQILNYLFVQVFSLIMAEIKSRRPADPNDKPVTLVLDEVYSLLGIPGMAVDLSQLSPQYRSRKLQLYIVLQELAQMSEELRPHVWSLGNVVSFAMSNIDEAYEISQQLFKYNPRMQKLPPLTDRQQPMMENDRGQFLEIANWIQRLNKRECIMRRHTTESQMEKHVCHVVQTKSSNILGADNRDALYDLKDALLRERGVRVRDALEVINRRHKEESGNTRPTVDL
jgi:hypothetical protein